MTSESSRATYQSVYQALVRNTGTEDPEALKDFILASDLKLNTKANRLNAIIALAKYGVISSEGIDSVKKARDEIQKSLKIETRGDNLGKQREKIKNIKIEHLDKMLSRLFVHRNDDPLSREDWLLFSLMWPAPLRNDLSEIILCRNYKKRHEGNCVFLPKNGKKPAELRINEHKTTSRGGKPIVRELTPQQRSAVENIFSQPDRKYLFETKSGRPLSSSGFSHRLANLTKEFLGIPLTSTSLRKIFLTGKYKDIKHLIYSMQEEDARRMGNSVAVQESHYIDSKT